ncbi:MAG: ROK family protein [Anaerolinea sp.]|nr:ROK family protein [Anaerolinea sp.]
MNEQIIGIDLGGTRLRVARLDHDMNILDRREILTRADQGLETTLTRMKELIRESLPTDPNTLISGIGISAPGPSNPNTGVIVAPPNLPGWHNVPIVQILQKEFGFSTYLGNDANVAALAEIARGAARGYRHVIFMTISTGIGGGIVSDGRLLLGKDGLGAEVGHVQMVLEDGRVSTLEKEAAGPALARQAVMQIEAGAVSIMRDMVEGNLSRISGSVVGNAALQGDAVARAIVERAGMLIGLGIVSLLHIFNPEIIVLGGGVSSIGDLLFNPMRAAIERHSIDRSYWDTLQIRQAELGENVSVVGAAALVVTKGGMEDVAAVARKLDKD